MTRLSGRLTIGCLLLGLFWLIRAELPGPPPGVRIETGVKVRMRDGVLLASDIYRPSQDGRWPTILVRTPYGRRGDALAGYRIFASRGYAVALQDVRGRYASEGTFGSIQQEGPDGSDTLNWIAAQSWSNGRIGMAGASYLGIVQWRAAVEGNQHLEAIFPVVSGDDEYLDRFYSAGGAMKLGHRLLWVGENFYLPEVGTLPFKSYIGHLPLRTADNAAVGHPVLAWQSAIDHPSYDGYWRQLSLRERLERIHVPIFSMGGWFDNYCEGDLDAFARLSKAGRTIETWIGPWSHTFSLRFPGIDFGKESQVSIRTLQLAFFDRYLKQPPAPPTESARTTLHLFVMGANVWREEHEWPLARTRYTPYYLSSRGSANTVRGDGDLEPRFYNVEDEPDHFEYDPAQPVPTVGGAICCNSRILPPGPLDQTAIEARKDVLVYDTPPLREDIEVTGVVKALLYVSTSANDTDFTAKLVDVTPSGTPRLVTDGIARLRYRLSLNSPVFVKRSVPYQLNVDAGVTSYVFQAGHRIRLEVSSSNFPRFDRNMNTTNPNGDEAHPIKAFQTVFHEKRYPSSLILPVIPRSEPSLTQPTPRTQSSLER